MRDVRDDFPQLKREVDGRRMVYLDSAATALKPKSVVEAVVDYYTNYTGNVSRGSHALTEEVTTKFENARVTVGRFMNADPMECIFTANVTDSINMIASHYITSKSDRVLATITEHHSNYVPWLRAASVDPIPVDQEGFIDPDTVRKMLEKPAKLVTVGHASNVTGCVQNVKAIAAICREKGVPIVIDGAQAAPHVKIDVQDIGCDFYAFSGHKTLGPTGIGVLWARPEILEKLEPFRVGGGIIYRVFWDHYSMRDVPFRFEAGTPHIAGAIGLGAALEYLEDLGMDEVERHEKELTNYMLERFNALNGVKIIGPRRADRGKLGLVSFYFENRRADEMGVVLSERYGIMCRSGVHCAQPYFNSIECPSAVRASTYIYSTTEDIDLVVNAVDEEINKAKK